MILTSDSTTIRIGGSSFNSDGPETFLVVRGQSYGETYDDPAGEPLQDDVEWNFKPSKFPTEGSEYSIWLGLERGSYHERWNEIYVTVGKKPPSQYITTHGNHPPEFVKGFIFSDIEDCCEEIVELTGCKPPSSQDLSRVIPPKQSPTSVVKPDQANKPRPGETPEQYWKRISLEKRNKFYYPGEGGIEREF